MGSRVEVRQLVRSELARVREIDRTEHIDVLYEQRGTELVARRGSWNAPGWDPVGDGADSVAAKRRELERLVEAGGVAIGAFADDRLVGVAVVVPHLRPAVAQLAFIHVTRGERAAGIGTRLCGEMDRLARETGNTEMVVSATPTGNTVQFYRRRGFEPIADPLRELVEREPDDVHMRRTL